MATSEADRVRDIMEKMAEGHHVGEELRWDPESKKLRVFRAADPDGRGIRITPEDMAHFA